MAQQNISFETVLSDPHFNLSAHTFAKYTLPFDKISSILDLFASDEAATHDLLALDQVNQSIVALEWQIDEHHRLATLKFSSLLQHLIAQRLPHEKQQPDCGCCRLCQRQPTLFRCSPEQPSSSSSSSTSSHSSSNRQRYWQMPPYPRPSHPVPSTSTIPLPFPPLTTRSGRIYPRNYFKANAEDCLHHLQTIPEERRWGTSSFPIVIEAPEADNDIFQRYYQWFINKGRD